MQIPGVRQRVRLPDRSGDFLVIFVDRERQVADLIPALESDHLEEDVPFSALRPVPELSRTRQSATTR